LQQLLCLQQTKGSLLEAGERAAWRQKLHSSHIAHQFIDTTVESGLGGRREIPNTRRGESKPAKRSVLGREFMKEPRKKFSQLWIRRLWIVVKDGVASL
jgi:hypothetical protein